MINLKGHSILMKSSAYCHTCHQVISAHLVRDSEKLEKLILEREAVKYNLQVAQIEYDTVGVRPKHKSGYLRLGVEYDSIEYYTERLNKLRAEIAEEQRRIRSEEG